MTEPRLGDRRRRVGPGRQRAGGPTAPPGSPRAPRATIRPRASHIPLPDVSRYLLPKEQIVYIDRRHPIVLVWPLLIALGIFLVAGLLVSASGAGPMVTVYAWVVVGLLVWLVARVVLWARTVLVVTDRRVFEYRSLVMARAAIRPVFRQSVVFQQGPVGERLNYGTILTEAPGGDRVHTFQWIHNPRAFYQAVTDKAV